MSLMGGGQKKRVEGGKIKGGEDVGSRVELSTNSISCCSEDKHWRGDRWRTSSFHWTTAERGFPAAPSLTSLFQPAFDGSVSEFTAASDFTVPQFWD